MGIDDSDTHVEAVEKEADRPAAVTQPDRPGVDGYPSRADSRKGAAAANDAIAASDREDGRKGIVGDGPSDDIARVADHDDGEAERGILASLKRAFTSERVDDGEEPAEVVDRPDFQDPREDPRLVPDRYDTPLERTDGTRTPLFRGEPTREQTKQGDLGDCGIIATLGAVAGHRPEAIRDCVRETDDGNYEVRLHEARYSMSRMRPWNSHGTI
ncbi:hypothetical protein [Actinoallomurus iriomotensis]|uniref:Calpain catalytic domain-containing protein n=1 Tax=Actinoallomurus iriomotensis TaxID=478107 RepID=A0A9W6RN49_9ACTN|nr:hypothetical protein [Actinoallomurus iriomotensis]GLY78693.1 hypothetical protein Airi01_069600 [Actinoallomurus iriomotensis]